MGRFPSRDAHTATARRLRYEMCVGGGGAFSCATVRRLFLPLWQRVASLPPRCPRPPAPHTARARRRPSTREGARTLRTHRQQAARHTGRRGAAPSGTRRVRRLRPRRVCVFTRTCATPTLARHGAAAATAAAAGVCMVRRRSSPLAPPPCAALTAASARLPLPATPPGPSPRATMSPRPPRWPPQSRRCRRTRTTR